MTLTTTQPATVVSKGYHLVPENRRMTFLPKLFGQSLMLPGEAFVYDTMRRMSELYRLRNGGYWNYYEVDNGARFMAPSAMGADKLVLFSPNDSEKELSVDAAGIVVTMFALSQMSFRDRSEICAINYHSLLDYVGNHLARVDADDARSIFALID